ncbi:MAG: hypothetical protein DRJ98_01775 [Thermoprotei archaeon]|nr:MAG: hypothetical protein DRJ98_01775 [Thermoprotei archaeon]RLF18117.1 MAG: hypothetical protein DRN06_02290 [Thermoprotei archaeon]
MKVKVEVWVDVQREALAKAASEALEVDNREAPVDLKVSCRSLGSKLQVTVEHPEPSKVLSTLEDLFTCLKPLTLLSASFEEANKK